MVLLELGVAENWLGDFAASERHLGEAVMVSRSEQFHVVTAEALSHLALTQFMAGREGVCVDLAGQALSLCDTDPMLPASTRARAEVALLLADAAVGTVAGPEERAHRPGGAGGPGRPGREVLAPDPPRPARPGRRAPSRTPCTTCELPFEMPALPTHLEVSLLVETCPARPDDGQP